MSRKGKKRDQIYIRFHQGSTDLGTVYEKELDAVFKSIREASVMSTLACTFHVAPLTGPPATGGTSTTKISFNLEEEVDCNDGTEKVAVSASSSARTSAQGSADSNVSTTYCKSAPPAAEDSYGGNPVFEPMVVEIFTDSKKIIFEAVRCAVFNAIQSNILSPRNITDFKINFLASNGLEMHSWDKATAERESAKK